MPTATEVTVLTAMQTALAGINGAGGGYTYDLSGTAQVVIGEMSDAPPQYPVAFIAWIGGTNERRATLTKFRSTMTVGVWGIATFSDDTSVVRTTAALNLALDFRRALESSLTLGGVVYDLCIKSMDDISGDSLDIPAPYAMVQLMVELWWERVPRT